MRELALPLAVSGTQVAAAVVVLGLPSWSGAEDFFVSPEPTFASALAASRLTILAIAAALFVWTLARAARAAARGVAGRRRRNLAGAAILVTGLLILGMGVARYASSSTVELGAGSVKEASQAIAR